MNDRLGCGHVLAAIRNSLRGLKCACLNECAFRQEVVLGVVHFALLFAVDEGFAVKLVLAFLWVALMVAELINSAVEEVVDYVSPEWNLFAKHAKDYCSAAVFLVAILLMVAWLLVLCRAFGINAF